MFKVQSNLPISGSHWGLEFKDGVAFSPDATLATKLAARGYIVTDETVPDIPKEPEEQPVKAKKKAPKDRALDDK